MQVKQVFFSIEPHEKGFKVVSLLLEGGPINGKSMVEKFESEEIFPTPKDALKELNFQVERTFFPGKEPQ